MNLAQEIQAAVQRNEQALASSLNTPKMELDKARLQHFADFCRAKGCRAFPAAPGTVAGFVREFRHSSPDSILATLADIEALHSNANLANPVATIAVRSELAEILDLDGLPRSWSKSERLLFASLPIEIRAIFARRIELDNKAVRKAHNERDAARKELEELQRKEISK